VIIMRMSPMNRATPRISLLYHTTRYIELKARVECSDLRMRNKRKIRNHVNVGRSCPGT
jgi:hypothetical protein